MGITQTKISLEEIALTSISMRERIIIALALWLLLRATSKVHQLNTILLQQSKLRLK